MTDLAIMTIVTVGALMALRYPWRGVMLWTWVSIMNPHRYAWGFAYTAPVAAMAAASTLIGLLFTKDRDSPFKGAPVYWLAAFCVWITLSWLVGLDPVGDFPQWDKVMKIYLMVFVGLALLRTKEHIFALVIVSAGSIAILGAKGGFFTIVHGGSYRVWGPPDSFIQDNNEFALAVVMAIPLVRFLHMQAQTRLVRWTLLITMLLCAASALGSHSRGGLLAMLAMTAFLWWRSKAKVISGFLMVVVLGGLIAFMPDEWTKRMASIDDFEEDRSALGRFSAWHTAFGIGKSYIAGVGFNMVRPELFAAYSPYPDYVHAAHSIYFLVLGNHGFVGLFLFLGIFASAWLGASSLRRLDRKGPHTKWVADLGAMCQVSLIGYLVGGAFLSLSYFDLPYNVMMAIVLARAWVAREAWKSEQVGPWPWWYFPQIWQARRA